MHRYIISFAIIVNGMPGTGSFQLNLEKPLTPSDVRSALARQMNDARRVDPGATMPNVTSIWKFED